MAIMVFVVNILFFRKRKRRKKKKRMQAPKAPLWYPEYAGSYCMRSQSCN
jgi:hypothetical protein